jgi:Uma2 family endonuclease
MSTVASSDISQPVPGSGNGHGPFVPIAGRFPTALPHRLTVEQVETAILAGVLSEQDRCELIRGELIDKMVIGDHHMATVKWLRNWFVLKGAGRNIVGTQDAIRLADSRPEPDITVLKFRDDFYRRGTPTPPDILLVVEVADSSLELDRSVKGPLYAENGIAEYWLVNLTDQCIEVYRHPQPGRGYAAPRIARRGENIEPLLLSDHVLAVDDVLGR